MSLARNQLGSNPPRVRISPSPPKKSRLQDLDFFSKFTYYEFNALICKINVKTIADCIFLQYNTGYV